MGIEAIYRKPNTSKPAPGRKIHPYLLRKMQAVRLVATRETLADSRSAHGDFQASLEIRNVRRHQIRPAIQRGSSLFRTWRSRRTALAHESGRADQARFRAAIVFDADEQFGASGHSGGQLRRGKRPLMRGVKPTARFHAGGVTNVTGRPASARMPSTTPRARPKAKAPVGPSPGQCRNRCLVERLFPARFRAPTWAGFSVIWADLPRIAPVVTRDRMP